MTLAINFVRHWNSFQLANSALPLSVTDSFRPFRRMPANCDARLHAYAHMLIFIKPYVETCLLGGPDLELSWTSIVKGDRHRYAGN
jgi:hypothetical protein